jgi:hypothetical protein
MTTQRSRPLRRGGWGPFAALTSAAVVALLLGCGVGFAVYTTLDDPHHPTIRSTPAGPSAPTVPASAVGSGVAVEAAGSVRDRIATEPMLPVAPEDALPAPQTVEQAPALVVAAADRLGPAGVPSGFPQTPQGAVGQLAAIDVSVLSEMSLDHAAQVYAGWALPDGPGPDRWEQTVNVRTFLTAARRTGRPAAGQIKGVDSPDWTLACVLLEVRVTITQEAAVGYGHCARMQWQQDRGQQGRGRQGRWMLAPGLTAPAPSTWPGTDVARRAGWRTWVDGPVG